MKVVTALTRAGYLESVRGRSGGFRLARPPEEIPLGEVLRLTEPDFALVECFKDSSRCVVAPCCRLPGVIDEALTAFLAVFDRRTLADVALRPADFPGAFAPKDDRPADAPPPA